MKTMLRVLCQVAGVAGLHTLNPFLLIARAREEIKRLKDVSCRNSRNTRHEFIAHKDFCS
jgi:hypothetical protein